MTERAETALRDAIASVEKASGVEVIVAVRPRLRRWLGAHAIAAALVAAAVLAWVLYTEWEFDEWAILAMPLLGAGVGWLVLEAIAPLERAVTPRANVTSRLEAEAGAAFHALGVHRTAGRTGLLMLVAVRERRVLLLGDIGIADRVGPDALAKLTATIEARVAEGGDAVAAALAATAAELGTLVPRSADDQDELPNLVAVTKRPHGRFRRSHA